MKTPINYLLVNFSFLASKKMDFILHEAEDDTPTLQFSEDEAEDNNDTSSFIDDTTTEQESISFYRDLTNLNHYPKFEGQTRNLIDATYLDVDSYFGKDDQPELYNKKNRNFGAFDKFGKFEKNVERFKNTLLKFGGVKNQFFLPLFMV